MKVNTLAVTRFVREVIGCNCPDEVFNHIEIKPTSATAGPQGYELNIGGRLLIRVTSDQAVRGEEFASTMQQGRAARDARGFNRFRLVVLTDYPNEVEDRLSQEFKTLSPKDEKMHLHVIAKKDFPDLFTGSE